MRRRNNNNPKTKLAGLTPGWQSDMRHDFPGYMPSYSNATNRVHDVRWAVEQVGLLLLGIVQFRVQEGISYRHWIVTVVSEE